MLVLKLINEMFVFEEKNSDNFLFYKGSISIEIISFLANNIRDLLEGDGSTIKHVYKVFIELAQNVSYYSAESNQNNSIAKESRKGVGYLSVDKTDSGFSVTTGNIIENSHAPILEKYSSEINSLSTQELRELKRKTRMQAAVKDIGAHIGLIHTGLISGSKLDVNIKPIDSEHSFYTICVRVDNLKI